MPLASPTGDRGDDASAMGHALGRDDADEAHVCGDRQVEAADEQRDRLADGHHEQDARDRGHVLEVARRPEGVGVERDEQHRHRDHRDQELQLGAPPEAEAAVALLIVADLGVGTSIAGGDRLAHTLISSRIGVQQVAHV
jgi:hypothetical protein